jgi:hypothetical protein
MLGRAAIGMLMFQLTMAPYSPTDKLTVGAVEGVIEDQLSYLSPQCRDVMFECLSEYEPECHGCNWI